MDPLARTRTQPGARPGRRNDAKASGHGTSLRPVGSVLISHVDGRVEARLSDRPDLSPALAAWRSADGDWTVDDEAQELSAEELTRLLGHLCEACAHAGSGRISWWARRAGAGTDRAAAAVGMQPDREVHQLRRSLPLAESVELETRPFRPGVDDDAWLEVNNTSFRWHEDQGGWTHEDLRQRLEAPWFDPAGFLIHERDGDIAGFCWTKVHLAAGPPLGEIYVIGVDPSFQGRGLGRALTLAGLDHLARMGITVAMLFVEADNVPALCLYRHLGFAIHHVERRYVTAPQPPVSTPSHDPTA